MTLIAFDMDPDDVRHNLYNACEVKAAICAGEPIWLCVCRHCGRQLAEVPRVSVAIEASYVTRVLAHVDNCGKSTLPPLPG